MTYLTSWEEFAKAAERLYLNDPQKVTFTSMQCSFRKHKHDIYIYIFLGRPKMYILNI